MSAHLGLSRPLISLEECAEARARGGGPGGTPSRFGEPGSWAWGRGPAPLTLGPGGLAALGPGAACGCVAAPRTVAWSAVAGTRSASLLAGCVPSAVPPCGAELGPVSGPPLPGRKEPDAHSQQGLLASRVRPLLAAPRSTPRAGGQGQPRGAAAGGCVVPWPLGPFPARLVYVPTAVPTRGVVLVPLGGVLPLSPSSCGASGPESTVRACRGRVHSPWHPQSPVSTPHLCLVTPCLPDPDLQGGAGDPASPAQAPTLPCAPRPGMCSQVQWLNE